MSTARCGVTVEVGRKVIARFVLRSDAELFAEALRATGALACSVAPDAPIMVNDPSMPEEVISF